MSKPQQNRLKILTAKEVDAAQKELIIIYGRAGIGKTRLALSIPEEWGKIAYYAADNGSEFLASIDRKKRDRVVVVKPEGPDPTACFMQFAKMDWREIDPEIGVVMVDTYTKVVQDSIRYSANSGAMTNEPHAIIGVPGDGGQAIPNRGDYLALESLSKGFLDMVFDKQSDMHVVFLCHEDVKIVEEVAAVGGPSHPGRSMTEYLPAQFSTVIRLIREQTLIPGEDFARNVVIAITENDGKFIAKTRTSDEDAPNPIARVVLDQNPSSYWKQYLAAGDPDSPKDTVVKKKKLTIKAGA